MSPKSTQTRRVRTKRMRPSDKWSLANIGLAFGVTAISFALIAWAFLMWWGEQPHAGDGAAVEVSVEAGTSFSTIARTLESRGVVSSARLLGWYARLRGLDQSVRAGRQSLANSLTPSEVLRQLSRGNVGNRFTIPEGLERFTIFARLEAAGVASAADLEAACAAEELLDQLPDGARTCEGYLFPATYRFAENVPAREVLQVFVDTFISRWRAVTPRGRASEMTEHQRVIMASLVEREAMQNDERGTVAGVFYNRLFDESFVPRGLLQTDPSVTYGCRAIPGISSCGTVAPASANPAPMPITRSMLADPTNPYNTYRHRGLPPGPISNPGLASLRAASAPQEHRFLYFVSDRRGGHHFSVTLEEHAQHVARFRDGQ